MRLRDVKKERVVLIQKKDDLCDNIGVANIDLSINPGKYKLYYLRIENEQRMMATSRLGVMGTSSTFSMNKLVDKSVAGKERAKTDEQLYYEESYSNKSSD
jgi:hypothetical protein